MTSRRQNELNRRYRANLRAELEQLRQQRGSGWRPATERTAREMREARALREIDEAWFNEDGAA